MLQDEIRKTSADEVLHRLHKSIQLIKASEYGESVGKLGRLISFGSSCSLTLEVNKKTVVTLKKQAFLLEPFFLTIFLPTRQWH